MIFILFLKNEFILTLDELQSLSISSKTHYKQINKLDIKLYNHLVLQLDIPSLKYTSMVNNSSGTNKHTNLTTFNINKK